MVENTVATVFYFVVSPSKPEHMVYKNTIKSAFALTQCCLKKLKIVKQFLFLTRYCFTNNFQNPKDSWPKRSYSCMFEWQNVVMWHKKAIKWTTIFDSRQLLCRILTVWSAMSTKQQNFRNIFPKQYCFTHISESLQNVTNSWPNHPESGRSRIFF